MIWVFSVFLGFQVEIRFGYFIFMLSVIDLVALRSWAVEFYVYNVIFLSLWSKLFEFRRWAF